MNQFLKNLFSPSKPSKSFGQSSLLHTRNNLASVQDGSENAVRQQLLQTLHRDLMRKNGIPIEWTACHTQVMVSRTKGTGMSVVLVVKHWDERLMNHTFAFQRALANEVIAFEPAAEQWLHGIAWRLDVASSCPHCEVCPNLPQLRSLRSCACGGWCRCVLVVPVTFLRQIDVRATAGNV